MCGRFRICWMYLDSRQKSCLDETWPYIVTPSGVTALRVKMHERELIKRRMQKKKIIICSKTMKCKRLKLPSLLLNIVRDVSEESASFIFFRFSGNDPIIYAATYARITFFQFSPSKRQLSHSKYSNIVNIVGYSLSIFYILNTFWKIVSMGYLISLRNCTALDENHMLETLRALFHHYIP
jgi:hypothetical protein